MEELGALIRRPWLWHESELMEPRKWGAHTCRMGPKQGSLHRLHQHSRTQVALLAVFFETWFFQNIGRQEREDLDSELPSLQNSLKIAWLDENKVLSLPEVSWMEQICSTKLAPSLRLHLPSPFPEAGPDVSRFLASYSRMKLRCTRLQSSKETLFKFKWLKVRKIHNPPQEWGPWSLLGVSFYGV